MASASVKMDNKYISQINYYNNNKLEQHIRFTILIFKLKTVFC